jgi:hypothetical protein
MDVSVGGYGQYVKMMEDEAADAMLRDVYLNVLGDGDIELSLYPADTLTQARNFYGSERAVEGVRKLGSDPKWEVVPNFHFGHMQRGFCWTCNRVSVDRYIDIWMERIANEKMIQRDDWKSYWAWLEEEGIACSDDRHAFQQHFGETNRQSASPRPGLKLLRRWPLADAEVLDDTDAFNGEVEGSFNQALTALGLPPFKVVA